MYYGGVTIDSHGYLVTLDAFAPQLLLVSAGFDAHRADPLAGLELEDEDFGWVTARLAEAAGRHAQGRMISVLEGGYEANFLVLEGNPIQDFSNVKKISIRVKRGDLVK